MIHRLPKIIVILLALTCSIGSRSVQACKLATDITIKLVERKTGTIDEAKMPYGIFLLENHSTMTVTLDGLRTNGMFFVGALDIVYHDAAGHLYAPAPITVDRIDPDALSIPPGSKGRFVTSLYPDPDKSHHTVSALVVYTDNVHGLCIQSDLFPL